MSADPSRNGTPAMLEVVKSLRAENASLKQEIDEIWEAIPDDFDADDHTIPRVIEELVKDEAERQEEIQEFRAELSELRAIISESCAAIGNGSCCEPDCSLEFMRSIPNEIRSVVGKLRAELAKLKAHAEAMAKESHEILRDCECWRIAKDTRDRLNEALTNYQKDNPKP